MKIIVVEDDSYEIIDKAGLIVRDGDIVYKDNIRHIIPVITGSILMFIAIGIVYLITGHMPYCINI